jgi:hypothetical protein
MRAYSLNGASSGRYLTKIQHIFFRLIRYISVWHHSRLQPQIQNSQQKSSQHQNDLKPTLLINHDFSLKAGIYLLFFSDTST